jgi:NADH:ubiquinone oxidoreductase subunit E
MKPAEKKNTGRSRAWLAELQNQKKRLRRRAEEFIADILDTDEDRVIGYYLQMNTPQKKQFAHA